MLQGHAAAAVGGDRLPHPLQALGFVAAGDGEAEPAVHPGGEHFGAGGHLVLGGSGVLGLPVQGERLVEVVLAVMALHVPHHEQLALDGLAGLDPAQQVEPHRPLGRERQPVRMCEPRVVRRVRGVDLLHPPQREDRDVAGDDAVADPAGDLDGAGERLRLVLDGVGQGVQVVGVPTVVGHGGQVQRRRQAQGGGAAQQPLQLGGGDRSALHAG